jgi:transcriptional regulator with XRE-family HTH domain
MPSFRISITPSRKAAARFVTAVRRKILAALEEEGVTRGLKQADIARTIGVHRSVINRELRGKKDITLGRVAELASAMGRVAVLELQEIGVRSQRDIKTSTDAGFAGPFMPPRWPATITDENWIDPANMHLNVHAANANEPPMPRVVAL